MRAARERFLNPGALFGAVTLAAVAGAGLLDRAGLSLRACPFLEWTGLPCPTCYGMRALASLSRFDAAEALVLQPLVASAALLCLAWGAASAIAPRRAAHLSPARLGGSARKAVAWTGLALFAANWAYLLLRR